MKQDKIHSPCLPYSQTSQLICFRYILGGFPPNYKKQQGKHRTCVLETNLMVTDTIKLVFNRRETPTSAQVAQYFVCSKRRHLFQFSWSELLHAHQQHSQSVTKSIRYNQRKIRLILDEYVHVHALANIIREANSQRLEKTLH